MSKLEAPNENQPSQKELFKRMEELRKEFAHIKIDPTIDLSALANEMAGDRRGLREIIEQAEKTGFVVPTQK